MTYDQLTPEELRALATKWKAEIELYGRLTENWNKRGSKVVQRYMDERMYGMQGIASDVAAEAKFNILWANTQTIAPATYSRQPRPEVSRRYQDRDPVGRVASTILERCLRFEAEQYADLDSSMRQSLQDRLLPGRGIAWIRYEPKFGEREVMISEDDLDDADYSEGTSDDAVAEKLNAEPETEEYLEHECAPIDYVNWKDFGHNYARTWEEVSAVWRRVYMSKGELEERFGPVAPQFGYSIEDIPLDQLPDEVRKAGGPDTDEGKERKACVYELWDKGRKRCCWLNETIPVPLDVQPDPLRLDGFFPCPKPLYATLSNNSLIPVPDYCLYQDQARELDEVTNRIGMLQKAVKVVGVYDASQTAVKRMLNEGVNNTLIPVNSWAAFAEKGGIKGVVDWLPLDVVINALNELYSSREQIKQVIYEITGLADIIRGATKANETATAQQIKANYAGLRIKSLQNDVARFGRDLIRLRSEVMCNFYSDETLIAMSNAQAIPEIQQNPQILQAAMQLLRNDVLRDFTIDIETNSMVEIDEAEDRESAQQMLTAMSQLLKEGLPIVQAVPELGQPIGETLMFVMRKFGGGKNLESAWEDALAKLQQKSQQPKQPPPPDPRMQVENIKAQTAMQIEPIKAQAEVTKAQAQTRQAEIDLAKTQIQAAMPAPQTMQ